MRNKSGEGGGDDRVMTFYGVFDSCPCFMNQTISSVLVPCLSTGPLDRFTKAGQEPGFPRNGRISQTNSQFTYKNQCRDVLKVGVLLMQDVLVGSKLIGTTMPGSTF
jgi:hypothetical protein